MKNLKSYASVTSAYWAFTLTDGALRMLVLLHFHTMGYSPVQIAFLFLFYEFTGIFTNLIGGWITSKVGLKITLYFGLFLQIFSLFALSFLDSGWPKFFSVMYVFCIQGISGIAKDLTKMSSKSAIKLLVPEKSHSILFKWVAILTGSKNALKGLGFFLGGLLLSMVGFQRSLFLMAAGLMCVLMIILWALPKDMGNPLAKIKFKKILSKSHEINLLSGARAFLFGSRDVWFVVGLPIFLYDIMLWEFETVGAFFALWVIAYGFIQGLTPQLLRKSRVGYFSEVVSLQFWTFSLCLFTVLLSITFYFGINPLFSIVGGLSLFGGLFAINSSLHSFLILAFSKPDQVALSVGFYYMANSLGRFFGTLFSGFAYQFGGLLGCLVIASLMIGLSGICVFWLTTQTNNKVTL